MPSFVASNVVLRAEILWSMEVIMSHYSYKSCEDAGVLFRTMFPDSAVAQKVTCGERKTNYLICYGLATHFNNCVGHMNQG